METHAELGRRFEYDVEILGGLDDMKGGFDDVTSSLDHRGDLDHRGGLDEFEPESGSERAAPQIPAGGSGLETLPHAEALPRAEARPLFNDALQLPRRRWPIVMPLAAAVLALSAVAGFALREQGLPPVPSAPPSPAVGAQMTPIPVADVPVLAPAPRPTADVPELAAPARAGNETLPATRDTTRGAIDEALAGVSRSFQALDAPALTRVWPGADVAAWSERFSTLRYQRLSFDRCDARPVGAGQIVASCDVSIAAAANSGDPALQRRHESWLIVFNRSGDRYVVGSTLIR